MCDAGKAKAKWPEGAASDLQDYGRELKNCREAPKKATINIVVNHRRQGRLVPIKRYNNPTDQMFRAESIKLLQ